MTQETESEWNEFISVAAVANQKGCNFVNNDLICNWTLEISFFWKTCDHICCGCGFAKLFMTLSLCKDDNLLATMREMEKNNAKTCSSTSDL